MHSMHWMPNRNFFFSLFRACYYSPRVSVCVCVLECNIHLCTKNQRMNEKKNVLVPTAESASGLSNHSHTLGIHTIFNSFLVRIFDILLVALLHYSIFTYGQCGHVWVCGVCGVCDVGAEKKSHQRRAHERTARVSETILWEKKMAAHFRLFDICAAAIREKLAVGAWMVSTQLKYAGNGLDECLLEKIQLEFQFCRKGILS